MYKEYIYMLVYIKLELYTPSYEATYKGVRASLCSRLVFILITAQ